MKMATYGLIATKSDSKVPLQSIDVHASIQGCLANVETVLIYENQEDEPIEASFIFPLDDNCAIHKFEAVIEGRLIVAECQSKEQARETYNDAIEAGQTAFIMEEDDAAGDVFECKVGNLPPHTEAKITFVFVTMCVIEKDAGKGRTTFVYPCVLGPRYGLSTPTLEAVQAQGSNHVIASGIASSSSSSSRKPKKKVAVHVDVGDIDYTFSATIDFYCVQVISAYSNSKRLLSCSREDNIAGKPYRVKIDKFDMTEDLEVCIVTSKNDTFLPQLHMEKGNPDKAGILKQDMVMLQFHPDSEDFKADENKRGEYIFVIDRSGSMTGDRIDNAKKALKKCLELLPEDCYFNIVSFGTQCSALFNSKLKGRSLKYSKDLLEKAMDHVTQMDANFGGTEMSKPFEWIYSKPVIDKYPRQIILLTDGAVWGNDMQNMYRDAQKNSHHTRVFTFGIGFGASTALIRGLARSGRGKCDFIKDDMHKMKKQVACLLKCAMSPAVSDVQLSVDLPDYLQHTILPTELPPIFMGEDFIMYALLSKASESNAKSKKKKKNDSTLLNYTLTGQLNGKKLTYHLAADLTDLESKTYDAQHLPIHRLAAKAQIKEYQDNEQYNGENKGKIELVSTAANVMSRYTSFVGVDKGQEKKVKGKQKKVDIPLPSLTDKKKKRVRHQCAPTTVMMYNAFCSAPRLYGGAGPDAPQADKYIGGKTTDIPNMNKVNNTSSTVFDNCGKLTEFCDISFTGIQKSTQDKRISNIDKEDADELTEQDNVSAIRDENSMHNSIKRKSTRATNFTVKRKKLASVSDGYFAKWKKDGYYYFATFVKKTECNMGERVKRPMRFKDGFVTLVHKQNILSACVLSPGDVISVHSGPHTYIWALVLEYTAKTDNFLVAFANGKVERCNIKDIVIPLGTANKMMDRLSHDPDPKHLIKFKAGDNLSRELSTSDVAELHKNGWINEPIVSYWISHVLPSKISNKELLKKSHVFSPQFFMTLTDSLQLSEDFLELPPEIQSITVERQWRNFILRSDLWRASKTSLASTLLNFCDITDKECFIFPMYESMHWYVLIATLKPDAIDARVTRISFYTMDSYYKATREYELTVIKKYLTQMFSDKGRSVVYDKGVYQYHVPIQGNDWDCGLCALQCIEQTFQENLAPNPHVFWFCGEDLLEKRQEIAESVLNAWYNQQQ